MPQNSCGYRLTFRTLDILGLLGTEKLPQDLVFSLFLLSSYISDPTKADIRGGTNLGSDSMARVKHTDAIKVVNRSGTSLVIEKWHFICEAGGWTQCCIEHFQRYFCNAGVVLSDWLKMAIDFSSQ